MRNKTCSMVLAVVFVLAMMATGGAQKLSENALRRLDGSAATFPGAKLRLATPRSLRSARIFNHFSPSGQSSVKSNPGGLPGIDSVPNFTGAFLSQGEIWPFTMMGNDPGQGRRTQIPARIIAVSLELQNADLVTTTTVPIAPFERLALILQISRKRTTAAAKIFNLPTPSSGLNSSTPCARTGILSFSLRGSWTT